MNFTNEEMEYLKKYEENFKTAVQANYSRNIPTAELTQLHRIYERSKNTKYNLCKHCSTSILNFLKRMGAMYFEDLKIMSAKQENENEYTRQSKQDVKGRKRK